MDKQIFTTGEIAKYCGVNFRTVIRWIDRGHLKSYKLPGRGDNRIERDDFLAFLNAHNMPIPEDFQKHSKSVLVVDDDHEMAQAIGRVLRRVGYNVQVANDGFSAGAKLGTLVPDLVTLDLKMPGLHGREVLQFIRKNETLEKTKVLVVSAMPKTDLVDAVEAGADDYLEKPFENNMLIEKITELEGINI